MLDQLKVMTLGLAGLVSAGYMHAVTVLAQATPVDFPMAVVEKLGVVGGACLVSYFLTKAVEKKDKQLQEAHAKHLADLAAVNEERVADLKAQIEYLQNR